MMRGAYLPDAVAIIGTQDLVGCLIHPCFIQLLTLHAFFVGVRRGRSIVG